MSLKAKILKELEKKPRRLKELKTKLGNDKKIPKAMDELFHEKKLTCKDGVYAVATSKTEHALVCTIVKLGRGFGFAKPEDGSLDVFIPGKFLLGAMPGDSVMVSVFEHPRVAGRTREFRGVGAQTFGVPFEGAGRQSWTNWSRPDR